MVTSSFCKDLIFEYLQVKKVKSLLSLPGYVKILKEELEKK
jgi:hypothetical protein